MLQILKIGYILGLLLCLTQPIIAQNFLFNTRYLSAEDGLLGRRVNAIVQDDEGFIWIATNEGLNRFDGYNFQHFTKETDGLNSNRINTLKKDEEGNIFIVYIQDQFEDIPMQVLKPNEKVFTSLKSYFGKHYKEDFKQLRVTRNPFKEELIFAYVLQEENLFSYDKEKGLVELPEGYKYTDKTTGTYWVVNKRIAQRKNKSGKVVEEFFFKNQRFLQLLPFTSSYDFVFTINAESGQNILKKKKGGASYEIVGEASDSRGIYYKSFWQKDKLHFVHQDSMLIFNTSAYIDDIPRSVLLGEQNDIWIGTGNGFYIVSYKENPFKNYLKGASKEYKTYNARGLWANENFLYSFAPKAALRLNFETQKLEPLNLSKSYSTRRAVTAHPNKQLWIGGNMGYPIEQIDTLTGEVLQTIDLKESRQIWSIFEDKKQQLWIGTRNFGLKVYQPNNTKTVIPFEKYNGFEDLKKGKTIHITEDKEDADYLWLAAESGWYLAHVDKGIVARFSSNADTDYQILSNNIYYTYQDKKGIYWLGTAFAGLLRIELTDDYTMKSVEQFTTKNGFSSNTIYGIFEDDNGFLWMSSNNGIIKFNKETQDVQVFLQEDGLSHYEFNRGSYFQRKDGALFFGTLDGVVSFQPDDFEAKKVYNVPLKISKCEKYSTQDEAITDITQTILLQNKIVLRPNEHFFTLHVSLQDYYNAPKLKYAYKIKGFQKNFTVTKDHKIILNGLPYGRYTLIVKGQGVDNRYSTEVLEIPLIVLRPFYLQWWFILLSIVTLAASIWQFLKWRERNLKEKQQILEGLVAARTHEIQMDKAIIEQQAVELKALDKIKTRFFANISHELRTPLTLILSPISSMINSQKLDNRNFTYAALVQQNAQKLFKRINEILDLTKLEAREMELKAIPTDFYDFTKRLSATFESLAQQKDQQLSFKYELDKNLQILVDQDKFEHIFNNYLSNAIKYTPNNGQIAVTITEERIVTANQKVENQIVLKVNDNGQGIHPKDLPFVFDRFYQVKNTENKTGSSGIGLSLCNEIAQLMKGTATVESDLEKGSTFYFKMPYEEYLGVIQPSNIEPVTIDEASILIQSQESTNSSISNKPSSNQQSILLVEDNFQLRQYIQLILSQKYHVITAENGQEALKWLTSVVNRQPSLIISDIMMPIMDGLELLQELKSSDDYRHIPVVMLTARSNMKTKLEALRIGVDDYLLKPFQEEELLARIENLLKNTENRQIIEIETTENETVKDKVKTEKTAPIITEGDTNWLQKVEILLQKELANAAFNANELAISLLISRRQLQRRIKKTTGLTPAQYIKEVRLQSAKETLENGDLQTVNEVAYAVGFDTVWYFSKQYEERFGKKPIDYLK